MSARFYEQEGTYRFESGDGLDQQLDENNLLGNFHEVMDEDGTVRKSKDAIYDRVAVLDPRDELHYQYWRYDLGDETFTQLEYVVRRCGSFLVRQTALENIRNAFDASPNHRFNEDEFTQFLEAQDGE